MFPTLLRSSLRLATCALLIRAAVPGLAQNATAPAVPSEPATGLIGYWPLLDSPNDVSGRQLTPRVHGDVRFRASALPAPVTGAAEFNGRDSWLEVPADRLASLGTGDFSISLWLQCPENPDDVPGDLLSQYDPGTRQGFQLGLRSHAVTTTQASDRHLTFSIDNNRTSEWTDCGRPGNALLAFALAVHEDQLYAGTCEPESGDAGHVYRYAGDGTWEDCGAPDRSNSVTALAVFNGHLYAGTGKYRLAGSALPESENTELGGRVFRFDGPGRWTDCGQLPNTEAIGGLTVFRGRLYASSLYKPAGFFRYESDGQWTSCGTPDGRRVVALGCWNGHLYATSYDGGFVFRYDGDTWTDCGQLADNTQTYSFAVYQGRLHVGTWPSGRVYRFEDINQWTDTGRLGEELEVMGMLVHNGRLLAGTLPLAEVYEMESTPAWKKLTRLDHTPDVRYRRAWTMAEYRGQVFCSTLPSGKVHSFEAGRNVAAGRTLAPGWHHVAAIRSGRQLQLWVDGQLSAESRTFNPDDYDLRTSAPLRIGFGQSDVFRGQLSEVRLYNRSLKASEVQQLARP